VPRRSHPSGPSGAPGLSTALLFHSALGIAITHKMPLPCRGLTSPHKRLLPVPCVIYHVSSTMCHLPSTIYPIHAQTKLAQLCTGSISALAAALHWQQLCTGSSSALAAALHWQQLCTGSSSALAAALHWQQLCTGGISALVGWHLCTIGVASLLLYWWTAVGLWVSSASSCSFRSSCAEKCCRFLRPPL
jgi:hypothetical protein